MELQSLEGKVVAVTIPVNGKDYTMNLKVCRVKVRSVLFIEINREERKNIFRKVNRKDIVKFTPTAICEITIKDGVLPDKWESSWDTIGQFSPSVVKNNYPRQHFSKHSSGWAPKLPSTTNSRVGFPMV